MSELCHILFTQVTMQVFGACVILLAFVFFTFALYAANQAPKWSGKPRCASRCWNVRAISIVIVRVKLFDTHLGSTVSIGVSWSWMYMIILIQLTLS